MAVELIVGLALVMCDYCQQLVPLDHVSEVGIVEDAGYREDGVRMLRATGEIHHECRSCSQAWFKALELEDDASEDSVVSVLL